MYLFIASILLCQSNQIHQREAVLLSRKHNYEQSEKILELVKPNPESHSEYCFTRLLNNFRLNRKKDSLYWYSELESSFLEIPERYKVVANLIKNEIDLWGDRDEIDDIARDMLKVKDRLLHGSGGKKTQEIQIDIVKRLEKMIQEKEDMLNKAQQSSSQQNQQNNKPLEQSHIQNDSGKGDIEKRTIRKLSEQWGKLPPREQARALQEATFGLPARHREAIENYFRNLNQTKKN